MTERPRIPKLVSSALLVILTAVGTYITLTSRSKGLLTSFGVQNFKYFTVDSNLLLGLVCLAELILTAAGVTARSERVRLWLERLVYVATVAVALTFTVVVCVFAPFVGLRPLVQDANLYFHLIEPVLAMLALCAFRRGRMIPLWETALALVPTTAYGLYYTAVLLARGVRFPETDWYGFASRGVVGSVAVAVFLHLLTWALALLLRLAAGGTKRQARRRERRRHKKE